MTRGQQYSLIGHGLLLLIMIFGLPDFMHRKIESEPQAISVDILPIAPISNVKPQEKVPEPKPEKPTVEEKKVEKKANQEATKPQETPEEKPVKVSAQDVARKAEIPLPEKPKEVVRQEPKKPEPKPKKQEKKEDDLESILKSVQETAKTEEAKKPKEPAVQKQQNKAVSETYDNTLPLSMSEKDGIRNQIQRCWNVPAGAKDAQNLVVTLRIGLNQDGSVLKVELAGDESRYHNDSFFRAAADSAMRAVRKCSPLKNLPADKFGRWNEMELTFNPKDML